MVAFRNFRQRGTGDLFPHMCPAEGTLAGQFVPTRSLSILAGRNEKLAVRGQVFENLRANSRAICRKLSGIWADQTILQSVHDKTDSLLVILSCFCGPIL